MDISEAVLKDEITVRYRVIDFDTWNVAPALVRDGGTDDSRELGALILSAEG
jgi:hypothetical protein